MTQPIKVPSGPNDLEVIVRRGAAEPVVYAIVDGIVEVEDEHVNGFLGQVPGSEIQVGNSSPVKEKK